MSAAEPVKDPTLAEANGSKRWEDAWRRVGKALFETGWLLRDKKQAVERGGWRAAAGGGLELWTTV